MNDLLRLLSEPWPWYVSGPLIGLVVPALLLRVGQAFGISSSFRDLCAAALPEGPEYFRYDWRTSGWRLAFVAGITLGGFLAWQILAPTATSGPPVEIAEATRNALAELGIVDQSGFLPPQLMGAEALTSLPALFVLVVGGFLVGFGTRYAAGCTSGHAITGLSNLQLASLIAVIAFFAGGLVSTHFLLPLILGGGP